MDNKLFKVFFFLLISFFSSIVNASYSLNKVVFNLSQSNPIDTLIITNADGNQPINIQIKTLKWTKNDKGEDVYTPTKDLLVAPSVMRIIPSGKQIARVGWRTPRPIIKELTYRIFVEDVTTYKLQKGLVSFRIKSNIPIYITPANVITKIDSHAKLNNNRLDLTILNTGNVHIKINTISLTDPTSSVQIAKKDVYKVLFPQEMAQVQLDLNKTAIRQVNLNLNTDNGDIVKALSIK